MKLNQMMWYEGAKGSWTKMQASCQHSSRKIKSWNGLHSRQPSCAHSLFIIWVNRMDQGRFLLCKQVHIKVRKAHVNDQKEISKMERPWSFPCKQTHAGFSFFFLDWQTSRHDSYQFARGWGNFKPSFHTQGLSPYPHFKETKSNSPEDYLCCCLSREWESWC